MTSFIERSWQTETAMLICGKMFASGADKPTIAV